ncbi:biopolymer transporter ExbD [Hyphomicrobium sp.]|jgi:biopolymer transport protein TolR|uniref:ExbD/TolR family protein n=1 Tax=Hyphomicrobium sp. TaxID=82 RepID=UPI002BEC60A2|nr:biopolymer transporter ExbD [Hyphomicrobium sp.]HVZ03213.1 biopolymer transporter ExbD [Hyphomicrobium sp.]
MGMSVGSGASGDDDSGYKPLAEINVTPFVDVMLVLLIIFMVAAPLMVQGVPLELPKTSATKLGAIKKPMVVSLAPDGKLYVRDEEVTPQTLVSRLMEIKSKEGDGIVYVRADRKIAYGDVMELLGKVGESGFSRVSLLSQPSPSAKTATN